MTALRFRPAPLFALLPMLLGAQTSTLNLSHDLVAKGIASSNLAPNSPAQDARPLFEAAVAYAAANSIATVTADPGSYYFLTLHSPNQHALLNAIANVTIDLQNSDLYFASSNTTAIECLNCSSVVFRNFTVDYRQLPFTQATITAVDSVTGILTFQTLAGWQSPADFNVNRAPDGSDTIWMFVFRNGVPLAKVGRLAGVRPVTGNTVAIGDLTDPWAQPANLAAIQPGDTLVWTDRSGPPALDIEGGQKVTIHNVSVYSAGQFAVYFGHTAGAAADHVQVIPRPGTSRLIASNADGIHVGFALSNTNLTDNIVRRACDDAISMSATWIAAVSFVAGVNVTVTRNFNSPFAAGAPVSFVNPADASVAGSANIVLESPAAAQQTGLAGESVTLTLDKIVTGLAAGFGMTDNDPSRRGNGSVVSGNMVQEGVFSRGIWLAGLQSVQVHDNFIQRTSNAGILVQELPAGPFQVGPSTEVTIQNNLVDSAIAYGGVSAGPIVAAASIHTVAESASFGQVTTRPHSIIDVTGNRVTNSPRSSIRLENVAGGNLTNNIVQGYDLNPAANLYAIPPCCETMAQYLTDFQQPVLSTNSLLTTSGNTTADATGTSVVSSVSSASYFPRLAPNTYAVAYGSNFTAAFAIATSLPLPAALNGVTVQVTDTLGVTRAASLYYVAPPTSGVANSSAVCFLVPNGTAPGLATVAIGSAAGSALIDAVAPGIYAANSNGQGVAAALAAVYGASGSVTPQTVFQLSGSAFVAAPMSLGGPTDALIVSLYGTGLRGFSSLPNVTATIGGTVAQVQYAGPVAGNPGLDQVNLIVPKSLAGSGEVPVILTVDGRTANAVTIAVQ